MSKGQKSKSDVKKTSGMKGAPKGVPQGVTVTATPNKQARYYLEKNEARYMVRWGKIEHE